MNKSTAINTCSSDEATFSDACHAATEHPYQILNRQSPHHRLRTSSRLGIRHRHHLNEVVVRHTHSSNAEGNNSVKMARTNSLGDFSQFFGRRMLAGCGGIFTLKSSPYQMRVDLCFPRRLAWRIYALFRQCRDGFTYDSAGIWRLHAVRRHISSLGKSSDLGFTSRLLGMNLKQCQN